MTETELLTRLGVALAIGLLVGLVRGWQSRDEDDHQRAAGFRTFALSGLLGGVSGAIATQTGPVVLGFLFAGYVAAFTAFHYLEAQTNHDLSVTGVVAGMLTFALGAYALLGELRVAIACAVAMTLLLALRETLHKWVAALRWEEIRAILILLAMTFLLLPVLPNRTVDPWNALNPAQVWMYAILIAAISFGGYVAVRVLGERPGVLMAALAGGVASSTATTLTLARIGREHPASARLLSVGILIAGVVMVVRVAIVAALLNPALAYRLVPPLGAIALVLGCAAGLLLVRNVEQEHPALALMNPLEVWTALKLAGFIALVVIATEMVRELIGSRGVLAVALVSGVADVDAVTISMAQLGGHNIGAETAAMAVAIAVGVNTISKAVMAGWVGGRQIGLYVGAASVLALAAGAAAQIFHVPVTRP
jgi:uncharacterized membrane protein (DUF4010 family)